jgi:SAM-dependent methyltransferase
MLAPRTLPLNYAAWNRRYGAPNGRVLRGERIVGRARAGVRWRGPFAWQENNSTREFEFPWVYEQLTSRRRPLKILEIGGGLAGLQFLFAREGHQVTNLDPGITPSEAARSGSDFTIDARRHKRLCQVFAAPVQLLSTTISDAGFRDDSFDVVLSVSAIEHFTDEALEELSEHVVRVLRPDGIAVFTVDLFLDLAPFTSRAENRFGRNVSVRELLERSELELQSGVKGQLCGFTAFEPDAVQRDLASFMIGTGYPAMSQCLIGRPIRSGV